MRQKKAAEETTITTEEPTTTTVADETTVISEEPSTSTVRMNQQQLLMRQLVLLKILETISTASGTGTDTTTTINTGTTTETTIDSMETSTEASSSVTLEELPNSTMAITVTTSVERIDTATDSKLFQREHYQPRNNEFVRKVHRQYNYLSGGSSSIINYPSSPNVYRRGHSELE
ncbi:hypothetical protein FCOIX_10217 [Fusarium coicis]|nr:hypothetical protein FCOIX_10217 [Fusarium coicis]